MDTVLTFLGPLLAVGGMFATYFYGKGRSETLAKTRDREFTKADRTLNSQTGSNTARIEQLEKTVREIENALDRSYATTKYTHDNFPSKEIFEIKMDAVQDNITSKIDAVLQIIKIRNEAM